VSIRFGTTPDLKSPVVVQRRPQEGELQIKSEDFVAKTVRAEF
jgi:hypothetical protein